MVARDVLRGERESIASFQLDRLRVQVSDAHFRAGKIRHYSYRPSRLLRGRADILDVLSVRFEFPMREVQPRDIHAGTDHLAEHWHRTGRRTDGRNDSGFVEPKRHSV